MVLVGMCAFQPMAKAKEEGGGEAWPGKTWGRESPEAAGLSAAGLEEAAHYAGGRGCVIRHGKMVYSWGDPTQREDVASACKPILSFFVFKALETGRLPSVEAKAAVYEPRLNTLNAALGYKDREITIRDLANQTSCYGVSERPGTAFDYSDWQIALFCDVLFTKIYGVTWATVDDQVLHPLLTDRLQCEDAPTLIAFGVKNRAGRLAISPRDYARFGLLYLREGRWRDGRVLSAEHVRRLVGSPLPPNFPRTTAKAAEMIPGQRTHGATVFPDDEDDPRGSYSWCWWTNGVDRNGHRLYPGAPTDIYACLGHMNGRRGMAVLPSLDIVVAWNDTDFDKYPESPYPPGEFFRRIADSVQKAPQKTGS